MKNTDVTKDKDGQYYFQGKRMLVSHIRGGWKKRFNPRYMVNNNQYNPYEPEYLMEWFPGPVGCVVAINLGGELRFGFSRVNLEAGDKYNSKIAVAVAVNRALYDQIQPPFENHRYEITEALERMWRRANNYFRLETLQPPSH